MSSEAKVAANRQNAQKCTGPKTVEGKARSSRNALKHGLLSKSVVLDDEDADVFLTLKQTLHEELAPVGEGERFLVDRIALCQLRLARIARAEGEILTMAAMPRRLKACATGYGRAGFSNPVGTAFASAPGETGDRLLRYERSYESSLLRALHELERTQRRREGDDVPTPVAVDVDIVADAGAAERPMFIDATPAPEGEPSSENEDPSSSLHGLPRELFGPER